MRHRGLLIAGVAAVTASVLMAAAAMIVAVPGASIVRPGGMMSGLAGGGGNIGIARAVQIAQGVAASYPGGGLVADEVIEFSNGYYASIREQSTGIGAFEILIDRATGAVAREPGPDMMWNTRYGAMAGGMMRGALSGTEAPSVDSSQARDVAQHWLDSNQPGAVANAPDPFYGYYTIDFARAGRLTGMLSVDSSTGAVWYHGWHGSFVEMKDLG